MASAWSTFRTESVRKLYQVPDSSQFAINEKHLTTVDSDMAVLLMHPDFTTITTDMPLNIKTKKAPKSELGSHIAPFDAKQFVQALFSRGFYTCGGNVLWGNPFFSVTPHVPINTRGILYSKDYHFRRSQLEEAPYPGGEVLAVFNADPDDFLANLGYHRSLAPGECKHAFIRRIKEAIASNNQNELKLLKQMCLSAVVEIRLFKDPSPDQLMKWASNLREKVGADHVRSACRHFSRQCISCLQRRHRYHIRRASHA